MDTWILHIGGDHFILDLSTLNGLLSFIKDSSPNDLYVCYTSINESALSTLMQLYIADSYADGVAKNLMIIASEI